MQTNFFCGCLFFQDPIWLLFTVYTWMNEAQMWAVEATYLFTNDFPHEALRKTKMSTSRFSCNEFVARSLWRRILRSICSPDSLLSGRFWYARDVRPRSAPFKRRPPLLAPPQCWVATNYRVEFPFDFAPPRTAAKVIVSMLHRANFDTHHVGRLEFLWTPEFKVLIDSLIPGGFLGPRECLCCAWSSPEISTSLFSAVSVTADWNYPFLFY